MRKWLRVLRVQNSWTQKEAADRLKMSQPMYAAIENGNRKKVLTLDLMENISKVFSIPYEKIMEYEKGVTND